MMFPTISTSTTTHCLISYLVFGQVQGSKIGGIVSQFCQVVEAKQAVVAQV